ncbi:MAG: DUF1343 domain-containing protein [bacterium]|nr:DUF1343 domain-containing protein [bacterium]
MQSRYYILLILFLTIKSQAQNILTGASQTEKYVPLLKKKKIALVVNQTSTIGNTHLVDSLQKAGVNIQCIFAPEHGFRGNASAGTLVNSSKDERTGIKIISLYGNHKKPTTEDLKNIDQVVFDIQDVGVRFYTYISTMHYVMEACAENRIPFLVLDRPNPNGHYIDGPVLDTAFRSFVGMHKIPIVHGCTVGEIAKMINGEGWLKNRLKCDLSIISCSNYTHLTPYVLPVKPSPNLQTQSSIYLYPSLGLFEGTVVSIGQGTNKPYQCFGSPDLDWGNLKYRPYSMPGVSERPKFMGFECIGFDLTWYGYEKARFDSGLNLNWLMLMYKCSKDKGKFFTDFFDKLAGTNQLRLQIIAGKTLTDIKQGWQKDLEVYKQMRKKYLLYD